MEEWPHKDRISSNSFSKFAALNCEPRPAVRSNSTNAKHCSRQNLILFHPQQCCRANKPWQYCSMRWILKRSCSKSNNLFLVKTHRRQTRWCCKPSSTVRNCSSPPFSTYFSLNGTSSGDALVLLLLQMKQTKPSERELGVQAINQRAFI